MIKQIFLKAWIDILITICIISTFFTDYEAVVIGIYIYTSLVLLARLISLFSKNFSLIANKGKNTIPNIVYHVLYLINTSILLYTQEWILSGLWFLIWVLAWNSTRKISS
jgi:hypothetical protein